MVLALEVNFFYGFLILLTSYDVFSVNILY